MGLTCSIVPAEAQALGADEAAAIAARLGPLLEAVEWDGAEPLALSARDLVERRALMSKAPAGADAEGAWVHVCQCTAVALRLSRELPDWRWTVEDDLEMASTGFGVDELGFRAGRVDGGDDDDRAVRGELALNLGPGAMALLRDVADREPVGAEDGRPRGRKPRQTAIPRARRQPARVLSAEPPTERIGTLALEKPAGGPPPETDPEQLRLQRHKAMRGHRHPPIELWQSRRAPGERSGKVTLALDAPETGRGHLRGTLELFDERGRKLADTNFSGEGYRPAPGERGVTSFPIIVTYQGACAWARARVQRVELVEPVIEQLVVDGRVHDEAPPPTEAAVRVPRAMVTLQAVKPGAGQQQVDVELQLVLGAPARELRVSVRFYAAHGGVVREVHRGWVGVAAGVVARHHQESIRPLERYARVVCVVSAHLEHEPVIGALELDDASHRA